ncbi:MAG: hypothetical protein JNM63_13695, partial [Spirochaetia bacterium]|nr:hypothetical protein [Spirochaetia bacterium]
SDYSPFALVELARNSLRRGDAAGAHRLAEKLLRDFPASKRGRTALFRLFDDHWNRWLQQFPIAGEDPKPFLTGVEAGRKELESLARRFRQPLFDSAFLSGAAQRLRKLGHFSEITNHYASQGLAYRTTLLDLGEYRKVVEDPGSTLAVRSLALAREGNYQALFQLSSGHRGYQIVVAHTLINMGRSDKVFSDYAEYRDALSLALLRRGRYAEVLRDYPDQGSRAAEALFFLGRDAEILARHPQTPAWILARSRLGEASRLFEEFPENRLIAARAHYFLKHFETAALDFSDIPEPAFYAAAALAVKAARQRNPAMKNTWLARLGDMPFDFSWPDFSAPLARFLLPALLDLAGGRPDSVTAACEKIREAQREHFGKTLYHTAALVLSPEPDFGEWEAQPTQTCLEARKWLSLAIRAETRRNSKEALEFYFKYEALPMHLKLYS